MQPKAYFLTILHHDSVVDYKSGYYLLKEGIGLVVPSSHLGKPNTRFAIVNPQTTTELLTKILDTMEQM